MTKGKNEIIMMVSFGSLSSDGFPLSPLLLEREKSREAFERVFDTRRADIRFLTHVSSIFRQSNNPVCVHGRAKPVLHGPNSTEPNLRHHGETTYRVGLLSEYATGML